MNGELNVEQVGNLQKHTDNSNLMEDSIAPIEQTSEIHENKQKHETALAKSTIETEDLASGKKGDKPSVHVKVFCICMRCKVKLNKEFVI